MNDNENNDILEMRIKSEIELTRQRIEAGKYLEQFRKAKNLSRQAFSKYLGVSGNYISEIERGYKMPSDTLIRKLAYEFGINEEEIFIRYGKPPLLAREEFENSKTAQRMLAEIAKNENLSASQKESIYEQLYQQCIILMSELKKT